MSKPTEEIDLNINEDISDDDGEYEYESTTDDDITNDNDEADEYEENTINETNDDGEENFDATIEYENEKTNEDSVTKSDYDNKVTMSDTFIEDDEEDEDDDIFDVKDPSNEMKENLQVPDDERISRNILTKYEMVRLLGTRAKQISDGSKVFVKYDGAKSAMELAELELEHKIIPLKIKRPMPNGRYEIWRLSELEII